MIPPNSESSSILSNITNKVKVTHKASKLDLLDDTTLTSLPIPPPLKRKNSEVDQDDILIDDSSDQIVLVEDYLISKPQLNKKRSLAIFKSKLNKRIKTNNHCDLFVNDLNLQSNHSLKYCNLCEKPLYELSSFINNSSLKNNVHSSTENNTNICHNVSNNDQNLVKKFTEFVCQECVEIYDQFFNELSELEKLDEYYDNLINSSFNLENPDFDFNDTMPDENFNQAKFNSLNSSGFNDISNKILSNYLTKSSLNLKSNSISLENVTTKSASSKLSNSGSTLTSMPSSMSGSLSKSVSNSISTSGTTLASNSSNLLHVFQSINQKYVLNSRSPKLRKFSDGLLTRLNELNKLSSNKDQKLNLLNFYDKFKNWKFKHFHNVS